MNQSISSDALKTERYFDEEIMFQKRKVKVYLRTVTRKSIKIELPTEISTNELKQIINKKFNIPDHDQIMYLKGTCLNFNPYILLQNNWIIHVINLAEVQQPEITVEIKTNTVSKNGLNSSKTTISSFMTVKNFVQNYILSQYQINFDQIILVESGRILKHNATFREQNIQNGTTINLIHSKKDQHSQSNYNFPQLLQSNNKDNTFENLDKISQNASIKTVEKKDWKFLKIPTSVKREPCSIHQNKQTLLRDSSHQILGTNHGDLCKTHRQSHDNLNAKNLSIQIGQRQCNCKKQVKQKYGLKQPKFITVQQKKKLSKEIRLQNLNKLIRAKQKKEQQHQVMIPETDRKTLSKVRSLQQLKPTLTQRKKSVKLITNPQKNFKF